MKRTKLFAIAATFTLLGTGCASQVSVEEENNESGQTSEEVNAAPAEPLEGPEIVEEEPDRNAADGRFVIQMLPLEYQSLEVNILADRNGEDIDTLMLASEITSLSEGKVAILDDLFFRWSLPYYQGDEPTENMSYEGLLSGSDDVREIRLVHGADGIDHADNNYLVDENPIYEPGYEPTGERLMSGMLSDTELIELYNATGTDFDKLWLEAMILNHEKAIEIAETHQAEGTYPVLMDLSAEIIAQYPLQVSLMEALLANLEG